jgi:hypothetical protein
MTCLAVASAFSLGNPHAFHTRQAQLSFPNLVDSPPPISNLLSPPEHDFGSAKDARDLQLLLSAGRTIQPIGDTDSFGDSS